jgi:hypothetical protein
LYGSRRLRGGFVFSDDGGVTGGGDQPGHQDLHRLSPRGGLPRVPIPRPPTLHGHRDAQRRHPARPEPRAPTPLDHAQLLRPKPSQAATPTPLRPSKRSSPEEGESQRRPPSKLTNRCEGGR